MVLGGEGGEGGEGVLRDETALAEPEGLAEAFHLRGVDKIPICVIGLDIIMHILMLTCQLPIEVGGRPSEGSKLFLESRTNINIQVLERRKMECPSQTSMVCPTST